MPKWLPFENSFTRGTGAYICKMWEFYDQMCAQGGCSLLLSTDDDTNVDDGQFMIT